MLEPIVILHLSDLHFGENSRFARWDPAQLGRRLVAAVHSEAQSRRFKDKPDLVIVTGDIAETAKPVEYGRARVFFGILVGDFGLVRNRFIFLPGNHDVAWPACKKVEAAREEDEFNQNRNWSDAELRRSLDEAKFANFEKFATDFNGKSRAESAQPLASGAFLHDFDDLPLSVAALNSCEIESHAVHEAKFSDEQANSLLQSWNNESRRNLLKIAAIHHNPVGLDATDVGEWLDYLGRPENKKTIGDELLSRIVSEATGVKVSDNLRKIANRCGVQLVLHGHHHRDARNMWPRAAGQPGVTHVLSAGSLGLLPEKLPAEQPNELELLVLDPNEEQIHSWFLIYEPRIQNAGTTVDLGGFASDPANPDGYHQAMFLPESFSRRRSSVPVLTPGRALSGFLAEYRARLSALFERWDLRNAGVAQAGGAGRPIEATLDKMYLPLRLGEGYDLNDLKKGDVLPPETLLRRGRPLAVRGPAGSGKTTWMRWAFRQLLQNDQALPIMVELRRLAFLWSDPKVTGEERSLDRYIADWIAEYIGAGWRIALPDLLDDQTGPRPVLLVDGWDELGKLGHELREKLVGFLRAHPRVLAVVSSRPYGEGTLSTGDQFEVLDLQPLSDPEIAALAGKFFACCYGEDEETRQRSVAAFSQALNRSPEAQALARTALLLTMMLLISRASPLPDKRHQLYHECIRNLLTAMPDRYEEDGVQLTAQQWRPVDGDARMRVVAKLAFDVQNARYRKASCGTTVVAREKMARRLPDKWNAAQRDGFLSWLAERAGLLIERADGTLCFTHLSFQEYLAAWHLDATIQGDPERIEGFKTRSCDSNWWETLRLWAAQIEARNPHWLQPVFRSLIGGEKVELCLAGTILADGLGNDTTFQSWADRFADCLLKAWSGCAEGSSRAWAASRQLERREALAKLLGARAPELTWKAWLRLEWWAGDAALGVELPRPRPNTNAQAVIAYLKDEPLDERSYGAARVLCGAAPFWPGGDDTGFLHLWPGHRRHAGLRLQNLANCHAGRDRLRELAQNALVPPGPLDEKARAWARAWARDVARDVARDWPLAWARDLPRDVVRYWALDWARDLARYWAHIWASDWARGWAHKWAHYWLCDWGRDVARNWALDWARDVACYAPHILGRYLAQDRAHDWVRDLAGERLLTESYSIDLCFEELLAPGRFSLPAVSASVTTIPNRPLSHFLASACRLFHKPSRDPSEFKQALVGCPPDTDPLWPALARHVARRSTPEDRALLEDLARHPEKRQPPLCWALRYIVRGDVVLNNGAVVTLDELADELGMPRLPYLEDMPEHFKF